MKKVVTIGGATQDIFIKYENPKMLRIYSKKYKKEFTLLKEGSKIEIQELSYSTGGGATNSAASFKRLGFDVSTIFKIGKDPQADLIIKALKKENIENSVIKITYQLPENKNDLVDLKKIQTACWAAHYIAGIIPIRKHTIREQRISMKVDMDLKTVFGAYFDTKNIEKKDKERLIDKTLQLQHDLENQQKL